MITDTLALLVLTVIVEMSKGTVGPSFWIKILISLLIFGSIVLGLFPIIGRWFFKRFNDNVSQYIFVLVIVFTGAFLAELAGIEPIIGAFLSGLSMNRLIPRTSALMNRVEFERVNPSAVGISAAAIESLLDELESEITRRGYRRVYLTTGDRQPEAEALYESAGYSRLAEPLPADGEVYPIAFAKTLAH